MFFRGDLTYTSAEKEALQNLCVSLSDSNAGLSTAFVEEASNVVSWFDAGEMQLQISFLFRYVAVNDVYVCLLMGGVSWDSQQCFFFQFFFFFWILWSCKYIFR